jgi:hypothetical protein
MKKKEMKVSSSGQFFWSAATYSFLESDFSTEVSLLNLSTCHVTQTSAEFIVDIIRNLDSQLHTLILDKCRLGIPSTILIFQALPLFVGAQLLCRWQSVDWRCVSRVFEVSRTEFAAQVRQPAICQRMAACRSPLRCGHAQTYGSFGSTTAPSLTAAPNDSRPISQTAPWRVYRSPRTRSGRAAQPYC